MNLKNNLEDRIISNELEIKKLIEESQYKFYIPPDEINGSIDWELVQNKTYEKSKSVIGEIEPITVAVNYDDPYKDSMVSKYRTHLRVINGRHKYLGSKETKQVWSVKFIQVKDFLDFDSLRIHFGSGKSAKKQSDELKIMVKQRCEYYYNEKGVQLDKICALVAKDFMNTRIGGKNFYNYVEEKYKQKSYQHKSEKKTSKKDIEINRLVKELDATNRELFEAKDRIKELEKLLKENGITIFVQQQNS